MLCKCGNLVKEQSVMKPGPNLGKVFFGCATYPGGCGFFQWAPPAVIAQSTSSAVRTGAPTTSFAPAAYIQHPQPQKQLEVQFVTREEYNTAVLSLIQRVIVLEGIIDDLHTCSRRVKEKN